VSAREWRLLVTEATDGATNMAVDEALWLGRHAGASPPTLRFFAWDPPTVSLGYGQRRKAASARAR
jgi:lipoate-protein ligase A